MRRNSCKAARRDRSADERRARRLAVGPFFELVEPRGFEPRTYNAIVALSQLSYDPKEAAVGAKLSILAPKPMIGEPEAGQNRRSGSGEAW
jgi:hypothetical protein